jgi:hypothetical protein
LSLKSLREHKFILYLILTQPRQGTGSR